jgi:competence protein ComFC
VVDLFYPPVCFLCNFYLTDKQRIICSSCWKKLVKFGSIKINKSKNENVNRIYILYKFNETVRQLIHLFKYDRFLSLAEYLAIEIMKSYPLLAKNNYSCIIPVPLHKTRKRERGYNQSSLLAKQIGSHLNIPVLDKTLIRTRNTLSQTKLNQQKRRENVWKSIECKSSFKDKKILLVDDIITTGNTLQECVRALRSAEVKSVDLLTIAGLEKTIFY